VNLDVFEAGDEHPKPIPTILCTAKSTT